EWVLISGKMGFEIWTAEVVQELQEMYAVKLGIIPPFENQESRWPDPLKQVYDELITTTDFYQLLYKVVYKGAYQFKASNKAIKMGINHTFEKQESQWPDPLKQVYHELITTADF